MTANSNRCFIDIIIFTTWNAYTGEVHIGVWERKSNKSCGDYSRVVFNHNCRIHCGHYSKAATIKDVAFNQVNTVS